MRRWLLGGAVIVVLAIVAAGCSQCPLHRALFPEGSSQSDASAPEVATHQQTCPVMRGRINPAIYTDYAGTRVYFCCPRCILTFQKSPERYFAKVQAQGA